MKKNINLKPCPVKPNTSSRADKAQESKQDALLQACREFARKNPSTNPEQLAWMFLPKFARERWEQIANEYAEKQRKTEAKGKSSPYQSSAMENRQQKSILRLEFSQEILQTLSRLPKVSISVLSSDSTAEGAGNLSHAVLRME